MTKFVDAKGRENVRLGNFERACGGLLMAAVLAILGIVWQDHEKIAEHSKQLAVIESRLAIQKGN